MSSNFLFENMILTNVIGSLMVIGTGIVLIRGLLGISIINIKFFISLLVVTTGSVIFLTTDQKTKLTNKIDESYFVEADMSKTLWLFKSESQSVPYKEVSEVEIGNGITVEKKVSKVEDKITTRRVLKIKCNQLNYEDCVQKVKDSLETIIADSSSEDSSKVVRF